MRHMWGQGVGHIYCHGDAPPIARAPLNAFDVGGSISEDTGDPNTNTDHISHPCMRGAEEDSAHPDTLEDLESQELDVNGGLEEEASDEDADIQDPDDEFLDEEQW